MYLLYSIMWAVIIGVLFWPKTADYLNDYFTHAVEKFAQMKK